MSFSYCQTYMPLLHGQTRYLYRINPLKTLCLLATKILCYTYCLNGTRYKTTNFTTKYTHKKKNKIYLFCVVFRGCCEKTNIFPPNEQNKNNKQTPKEHLLYLTIFLILFVKTNVSDSQLKRNK